MSLSGDKMKRGVVFSLIGIVFLFCCECNAENIFKKVGGAIGNAATSVADKVGDVASNVKEKIEDKVEETKEKIEERKEKFDDDDKDDDDKDDDDKDDDDKDDSSEEKNIKKDKSNANVPILSESDSKERMNRLQENAQNMKDKERSMENKLLGAAAIGATGIGGMNLLSGAVEQKADENAERDMQGYLASFRCNYGDGKQVRYGDVGVELPVVNLSVLTAEYRALAQDLKNRKDALGKQPGIEADLIIDSADAGLYDSYGYAETAGAFTSVARALMDKDGADAANWEKQKRDTASKIKTATATVAVASVGAIAANMAINNKKDKKNKSDEIMNEYESKKSIGNNSETVIDKGAADDEENTGSPGCKLTGVLNPESDTCSCGKNTIRRGNDCQCDAAGGFFYHNGFCVENVGGKNPSPERLMYGIERTSY